MWQEGRCPGREGRSRRETGSRHRQGFPGSLSLPWTPSVLSKALSFSETPLLLIDTHTHRLISPTKKKKNHSEAERTLHAALLGLGNKAEEVDGKLLPCVWPQVSCMALTGPVKKLDIGSDRANCQVMP